MTSPQMVGDSGHARFTFRLRLSSTARAVLLAEWARCRWLWNECVARSKKAHRDGEKCGPARLDKMLTQARAVNGWLREGSSVPQQQLIRDFGKSRAKALKDMKAGLPVRQRAGMPRFKKKHAADPSVNYTRRGFRLKDGRLHLAGGISVSVVWSRELPKAPSSVRIYRDSLGHWYASFVVATTTSALSATGRDIGIDWGVKETATTTSDAHDLPHAEYCKKAAQRLARYQRMMARRKPKRGQPGSKGYGRRSGRRRGCTRRWRGSVRTPGASGPKLWCGIMTGWRWRISGRSSLRGRLWRVRRPMRRSVRPSTP